MKSLNTRPSRGTQKMGRSWRKTFMGGVGKANGGKRSFKIRRNSGVHLENDRITRTDYRSSIKELIPRHSRGISSLSAYLFYDRQIVPMLISFSTSVTPSTPSATSVIALKIRAERAVPVMITRPCFATVSRYEVLSSSF